MRRDPPRCGASIAGMMRSLRANGCPRPAIRPALLAAALAANACFAFAAGEAPATAEMKVSVASGPALPLGKAAERWAQLLNETGDARLASKLYPGAALAGRDAARELAALKEGAADLAVGSALQWSLQVPALGVFALPFLAPERPALEALAASDALREVLALRLESQGVVLVALAALGHREIATTTRAIRGPGDLTGLRVRTAPSPMLPDLYTALGAVPQAMPFARAQGAFASGALDAQEGLPTSLASARVAASGLRHLTQWGAVGDAMVFAVRKAHWEGLSDSQREAVRLAAQRAIAETDAPAREDAALRRLGENGMTVVRITPAGHVAFRAAVADAIARWRGAIGDDVVGIAEKAIAEMLPPAAKGS